MRLAAALILGCLAGDAAGESLLRGLADAREVICDFRRTADGLALPAPERERADLMLIIGGIDTKNGRARVVTSRTVGSRRVRLYAGETGVHFVEDRQESVVVTSLVACTQWKTRRGRDFCTSYEALNSWHFDTSVHLDADRAFRKLGTSSYRGTCEPWDVN